MIVRTAAVSLTSIAEARVNHHEDGRTTGGTSFKSQGADVPGGTGVYSDTNSGSSGGGGILDGGTNVGGNGHHFSCDDDGCRTVGGSDIHAR